MDKECAPEFEEYGILPTLGKTVKCIDIYVNNKLKEAGVSLTKKQLLVLKKLTENGPLPQNDLAFITDRDKASLARFINTLEKKNLVARIPSSTDKRINMVHLTKQGEKVFGETEPLFKSLAQQIQAGIPQAELDQVVDTLLKIKENIHSLKSSCTNN